MAMTSQFRRSVSHDSKRTGGGGGGSWREQMRIPKDVPTPFMLINAEYTDPAPAEDELERDPTTGQFKPVKKQYSKGRKHKRKVSERLFYDDECSAGWDQHNPKACVGCFFSDTGDKSFTTGDVFRIGLVHLVPYHGHPVVDNKTNTWLMKKDSNEYFLNYDPCEATPQRPGACNYCRIASGQQPVQNDPKKAFPSYPPNSITWKFGHRRYLELGKGHLSDLIGWDQLISMNCATLQQNGMPCGSPLVTLSFNCPTCGSVCIDMRTDPRSDQQIMDVVSKPHPCMRCQRGVQLVEMMDCEVCRSSGRSFTQHGLFSNIVLNGMRQGEGTKSKLVLAGHQTIDMFARITPPAFLQGKTMQQIIEDLAKPYDFDQICKPRDLANQAQRYQLPLPAQLSSVAQQQTASHMAQNGMQGGYAPQGAYTPPQQGFSQMPGAMPTPQPQVQQPMIPYGTPPAPVPMQQPQQAPFVPGQQPQFAPQPQFQPNTNQPGPVPVPSRPNFS